MALINWDHIHLEVAMNLGPTELIIILAIILLLFGVGRLSRIGGELGKGIREFRSGLKGDDEDEGEMLSSTSSAEEKPSGEEPS
jgi:sec-independent protein translocase protein TatA